MENAPIATRRHGELARIGCGVGDEFGNGLSRNRRIDHQNKRIAADACHRDEIADKIGFVVVDRLDQICRYDQRKGMSVWGCVYDGLGADNRAATRLVVDRKWLAKAL